MPVMNGLELTKAIRSGNHFAESSSLPSIPIIGLSSDPSEQVKVNAYRDGMNAFLRKPIKESMLVTTLKQYIRKPSLEAVNSASLPLSEDSDLYKLGAKLVHDLNTPIVTIKTCNNLFQEYFPAFIEQIKKDLPNTINNQDTVSEFSKLPDYYKKSELEIQDCLDNFWSVFHGSTAQESEQLIKYSVDTLDKYWHELDNFNESVFKKSVIK